eukprot:TRINITY_DN2207_c0_g2_i6.p1 TRINITY_DN2207_c0_g2~~TRINITY_DN2207_c0_g2_i6.p1  ORF type:complete len:822 (+),score=229.62 TRINITY_DN2207_c0_g2_i6:1051-3516(+)
MQSFWFCYLAGQMEGAHLGYSPGRFDYYMYPYYRKDRDAGTITDYEVLELLEVLRVKMTMIEYVASFSWEGLGSGNLFQNMVLGGVDEEGKPTDNELSCLLLQAAINCHTTQPTLSVWYDPQLSDRFLMKAIECVKTGIGFPAWFNLKVYIQHELETSPGLPLATIRKYASMGGCTEPTVGGHSYGIVQPGFINHVKLFELALYGGKDPRTGLQFTATPVPLTYDELVSCYEKHLGEAIAMWQRYWNYVMAAHRQTCPLVFCSCLTRDCIKRGKSLDDAGAVVNGTPTTLSTGMVNVANSLAAVRRLLIEKVCTMDQLREALLADWTGHDDLKQRCAAAPKWGNNLDEVDNIFCGMYDVYCRLVRRGTNFLGKPYDPSMLAITTHAPFGRACFATPDGRVSGETLCDGVTSPQPGTDVSGPYAVLLSASKVDHTRIRGGLHNMKFHPSALRGVQGSRKLLDMIRTYFQSNAFQIQFNVVDSRMLRDAQAHPEQYRDLIVRVAGFSAFFVELAKPIQEEVILRTEHNLDSLSPVEGADEPAPMPAPKDIVVPDTQLPSLDAVSGVVFNIEDHTVQDGPGARTTVFLKGCPLRCKWCCNPEGQSFDVEEMAPAESAVIKAPSVMGKKTTVAELVKYVNERSGFFRSSGGGVTLSGGEPLAQPAFVRAAVRALKARGISVGIETSGCYAFEPVADIFPLLDFVYYDVKAPTDEVHRQWTGCSSKLVLENLPKLAAAVGRDRVIVSLPLIPGVNDNEQEMEKIAAVILESGVTMARVLPYHSLGSGKYERLHRTYPMPADARLRTDALPTVLRVLEQHKIRCWQE